jgi:hypothetical protein
VGGVLMEVTIYLASGEVDTWSEVSEVVEDPRGSLAILYEPGDEVAPGTKLMSVIKEDQFGSETRQEFQVSAIYASGMWMKVEFQ